MSGIRGPIEGHSVTGPAWSWDLGGMEGMREQQLARWSAEALSGLARVRRMRADVADRVLAELYLVGDGPRWIAAYFETISWLADGQGATVAVDRLVALTWAEGLVGVVRDLKRSRKLARMQATKPRKRHAECWRSYGVALLATGALLGRLRAAGVEAEALEAERAAWSEWLACRPVEAGVAAMRLALAGDGELAEAKACVPAAVRRALVQRWRQANTLTVV